MPRRTLPELYAAQSLGKHQPQQAPSSRTHGGRITMTTARTSEDISVTGTPSGARALLRLAGFKHDERGRWTHDDGRCTWATDEALRWALVTLAEDDDEQYAAPARSKAQVRFLTGLSTERGSLTAWNMIASGDVVCRFKDGSIVRIGIDGRYFNADRAALAAHTEAQE